MSIWRSQRTLWPFLQRCAAIGARNERAARMRFGTVVVADGDLAQRLLTSDPSPYEDQSGFFRIGPSVLSRQERGNIVRELLDVFTRWDPSTFDVGAELAALGANRAPGMAHQGWGVRFISRYFAGLLADRRVHPEFMPLIERYVEHSVIPDDIEGVRRNAYRVVPEVRQGFAQLFELNGAGVSRSRDLVDVVRRGAPGHDAKAQAELYQRLVLSFVGFTGVTLEWILFVVGTSADPHRYITEPDALVNETLRLYPTAWRLVRTARNSHDIESYPVNPGESVLLSINAAHRDPHVWPVAEVFDPGRWSNLTPAERRAFMPFGRGREMCPASRFAMKALCAATASILSGHAVSVSVRSRAKPKALTLLAPPAGFTRLLPIDQTMRASSTSGAKSAAAR